jgi:hypothetical protein
MIEGIFRWNRTMHIFKYTSGIWRVEARLENAGSSKRLAIISALAENGKSEIEAKHTFVFDHIPGCDEIEEAKSHAQRLLMNSH